MTDKNAAIGEISAQQNNQSARIKQDPRYQQIQQELALKKTEQQDQKDKLIKGVDFQDKVEIKSLFNWQKNKEGDYEIRAENRIGALSNKPQDIKYSGDKILRLLGYEINFTEKVDSLKDNYMKTFIETKATNLLMAKFSQIKFGMMTTLLSLLGVSTKELQNLQKKALTGAIEENESLFEQNEYNAEMLTIFSTSNKKDKKKVKLLTEVRSQLIDQMNRLGSPGFYSEEKILDIKKTQVSKIYEDLLKEKQNLEYMRDFQ